MLKTEEVTKISHSIFCSVILTYLVSMFKCYLDIEALQYSRLFPFPFKVLFGKKIALAK